MNILVLGGGGREHALCWKLAQSAAIAKDGGKLYAAPGNPGIAECAELVTLDEKDHGAVVSFCEENAIGLVVIGPEAPLVDGLADSLRAANVAVFGPSKAAAQLEGSKNFTKALCDKAGIPTAGYVHCTSLEQAKAALATFSPPFVLKADGLAAGKGVVIAENEEHAHEALEDMFGGAFGDAGAEVVIEEFMEGEEASFFALTDGETVIPFGTAQDHKRVGDGDTGPNTGGMGAYSPARVLTEALLAETMERIVFPTVRQMAKDGTPYVGVLYAGLMLTDEGPKLVEYNARFGDPECQVLMMRLESDLAQYMLACASGSLAALPEPTFADDTAMTVVMAAKGYPGTPEKGGAIVLGDTESEAAKVFHAGTSLKNGSLVANGGRVLNVTATGADTRAAQDAAYAAVGKVDFPSGFYRKDIGWREIART
ncbi:phosphoribosylamine--glycine ligase [Aurantiacibacter zhengii]|uniref:Phosphoribosylamine--glycine ligase n=1 Tax=Aurantiacibacter zhengii TaxID=2307003 RepID=A0A418NSW4_9SPHN|nr:phosphoribosylamine--glycine ligase [Aurantiacibacter zhengii]RIV86503.1 phosphoribosylamine--glycine ligase [Aurantiacibacter zhengii]